MSETKDISLAQWLELCAEAEVATGCAKKVDKEGLSLAVFHLDSGFYVTDDLCTHGPGSLSEGEIDGDVVECDFHNGAFNIRTGEVEAPPCMTPLRTYATQVIDGKVCIDPNQPAFTAAGGLCPKMAAA
jgi:nitrite reductase/ring-hydroxylating ferredoxin subunit